jgi:uncharacterized cupredoxin-like copper-binding protein
MRTGWILLAVLLPFQAAAQSVTPNFTQGSMTSTTTSSQTINETIQIKIYGGDYSSYSGTNITPSGAVGAAGTTYSVTTAGEPYQLETVTRTAGIVEQQDITRTITTSSTTNSLSVFSQ